MGKETGAAKGKSEIITTRRITKTKSPNKRKRGSRGKTKDKFQRWRGKERLTEGRRKTVTTERQGI